MAQDQQFLLKIDMPEVSSLPLEQQQVVLNRCLESVEVKAAWRRYWMRPKWIPGIIIVIFSMCFAFANRSPIFSLVVLLPVFFIGYFSLRVYYRKQLTAAMRDAAASIVKPENCKI